MANEVSVKFTADIGDLTAKAEKAKASLQLVAEAKLPSNNLASQLEKELTSASHKAADLSARLRQVARDTEGVKGVDGLGKAASRAQIEVRGLYDKIRGLNAEMGRASSPAALARIQAEARAAEAQVDRLNNKLNRVSAGRQAAMNRVAAVDSGKGRAVAGAASQFLPPELNAAAGLAEAAGIGGTGLAIGGGLLAVGVAAVKVSEKLKENAEKRLKAEEKLQGVYNEQAKTMASIASVDDLRGKFIDPLKMSSAQYAIAQLIKQRQKDGFGYGEEGRQTLDQFLAPDRALRDAQNQISSQSNNSAELQKTLAGLQSGALQPNLTGEARINLIKQVALQLDDLKRAMTGFSAAETAQFKAEQEAFKARQEAKKAEIKSVQETIKQYQTQLKGTADALFLQTNQENPFVKVFKDAERSMMSLRESTKLLSKDLRESMLDAQKQVNSLALFSASLDNKLESIQLRQQAATFRRGGSSEANDAADALARYTTFVARVNSEERSGLYRGSTPGLLAEYRQSLSPADALASFNAQRGAEERSGLFRGNTDEIRRNYERATRQDISPDTRFNKQIEAIVSSQPKTEQERALVDRKLLAIGGQLDPSRMTAGQREQFAAAAEREASRREKYEQDALGLMVQQRDFLKAISESAGGKLADAYNKKGLEGFNTLITVKNESDSEISVREALRSPTPKDTAEQY